MAVDGTLPAKGIEQLGVNGGSRQPFFTANHMGGSHQVVVHHMGKVIGWDSVGFEQNKILIVFLQF